MPKDSQVKNLFLVSVLGLALIGCDGGVMLSETGDSTSSGSTVDTSSASGTGGNVGSGGATSSSVSSSSATTGSGGETCVPQLTTKAFDASNEDVALGAQGFRALSVTLTASDCVDLEVSNMYFALENIGAAMNDLSASCAAPCQYGDWNFDNVKVMDHDHGTTVMGPGYFMTVGLGNSIDAQVFFTDSFNLPAGSSISLDIVFDVVSPFKSSDIGEDYRFELFYVATTNPNTVQVFDDQTDSNAMFTVVSP